MNREQAIEATQRAIDSLLVPIVNAISEESMKNPHVVAYDFANVIYGRFLDLATQRKKTTLL